jgi:hypothetical protein
MSAGNLEGVSFLKKVDKNKKEMYSEPGIPLFLLSKVIFTFE